MSLETQFTEIQTILQKCVEFAPGIELAIFFTDQEPPISYSRSSATVDAADLQAITSSVFSTTKRVVTELGKGVTQTITVKASGKFLFIHKIEDPSDQPTLQATLTLLSNTDVHIGIVINYIGEIAEELLHLMKPTMSSTSMKA
ncbi:MAG: roadblock/LC7 domain-containing protein [Promethearchaeota archaeon]